MSAGEPLPGPQFPGELEWRELLADLPFGEPEVVRARNVQAAEAFLRDLEKRIKARRLNELEAGSAYLRRLFEQEAA